MSSPKMNQEFLEKLLSQPPIHPSYLKPFEDSCVQLIFGKRPVSKHSSVEDDIYIPNTAEDPTCNMDETKADLTGNPLTLDLGSNANDTVQFVVVDRLDQKWYPDEVKHHPLPVREARRILNKILTDRHLNKQHPIYVVSNGDDCKKTVLMGSYRTNQGYTSTTIHVLGTVSPANVDQSIQNVILDHKRGCENQPVNTSVKASYTLYGANLKNVLFQVELLEKLNIDAHIYVDITSPKTDFVIKSFDVSGIELHAIIVSGHPLLKLNTHWSELSMLQRILNLYFKPTNIEHNLSDNFINSEEILSKINEVLFSPYELFSNEMQEELSDIRHLDTIDKLWEILICCEDTSTLRDSFNFLFESLSNAQLPLLYIEDDCSYICQLFKDVLAGTMAVTNISFLESLELLYEMGVRKLKYDFMKFLKCDNEIESVWDSFYIKNNVTKRTTRTTSITNLLRNMNMKTKPEILSYVSQLYVAAELLDLVKNQISLTESNLRRLETALVEKYVKNTKTIEYFQNLCDCPLQEISVKLDLTNCSFVTEHPSRWTMQLKSGPKVTMLDLSNAPIIPPLIYNYGFPEVDEDQTYYAIKMNRVTRNF